MNLLRLLVFSGGGLLLVGGYATSQFLYWQAQKSGDATKLADYSQKLDGSAVPWLSLAILVLAIALAFVPERPAATGGR